MFQESSVRPFKVVLVGTGYERVPDWVFEKLHRESIDFLHRGCRTVEELVQEAGDVDLVWVWGGPILMEGCLEAFPRCGAILHSGSGTDNIPVAEATRLGIVVANIPDAACNEVSDHAIGLLFAVIRRIPSYDHALKEGRWLCGMLEHRWHLAGQTLGVIGFGHVARAVARKMAGFGLTVLGYDSYVNDRIMAEHNVRATSLDYLLANSDFISVHCPLTTTTHHLISERELHLMKHNAVLINTSRGAVVDEAALIKTLKGGQIGGAGLDVFEQEPTPPNNPLLRFENVVVTPHVAGQSDLFPEIYWRYSVETIILLANGYWPRSVANPGVKPRWDLTCANPGEPATI
jgi:D-3-phosphoglycerate dehydrogenase